MNTPDWIELAGNLVWRTSLEASVLILLLAGLRWVGRNRLSPRFLMILWAIIGVRLLFPVAIESPYSVGEVIPIRSLESLPQTLVGELSTGGEAAHKENADFDSSFRRLRAQDFVGWLWVGGMLLMILITAIRYGSARAAIRRLKLVTDPLLLDCIIRSGISSRIRPVVSRSSIAIFGVLRASHLLLPERITETHTTAQILAILQHEREHLRRHDLVWNAVLLFVQTLHWFNPLVWMAGRLFQNDREIACDAAALHEASGTQRRHYGEALLAALACDHLPSPSPALLPFFSRKHELKQRLTTLMKIPHYKLAPHILASILTMAFVVATFTTPGSRAVAEEGVPAAGPKEGQVPKEGPRDGDVPKEGLKDGEMPKAAGEGDRGAAPKEGERPAANNANKKELEVFNAYDKNSDGQVSAEEMEAMIEAKQNSSGRREIRKAIGRADKDENEQLNFDEFLFWYKVGRLDDNAENRG